MGLTNFTSNNTPDKGNPNNPNNPNNPGIPVGGIVIGIPNGPGGGQPSPQDAADLLINYNEKFKNADKVMFRDKPLQQIMSVLIGKNKPNALLVGPAGTGKTAIVETLAKMLATNDPLIPAQLQGYTIWELPLSNIVAGASLVGQVEENIKTVIQYMEDPQNKTILFIDEIHQLMEGSSQTYGKIAQIMKPALARGSMRVIGATTLQEANDLSRDPAFNRRFSKVIVDELTRDQTIEILKTVKLNYMKHYHHQVCIDDSVLEIVANLADQYRPAGSHRPDNALTLLDRTVAETVINHQVRLCSLQTQLNADPNNAMIQAALQTLQANPITNLSKSQIQKTAIALATGNSKQDTVDMNKAKTEFNRIRGQEAAVEVSLKMMARKESNLFPSTKPTTMMFIGPSGVGKTEIAKIIAKNLTGQKPIILNMTEYSNSATINRIIGAPAGYIGSDSKAELPFDELESNPYAVILLDEFEKAHPSVQRLFYTVFDEGNMVDNRGKTIDFSKAVIIATTNAGHQEIKTTMGFGQKPMSQTQASTKELSKFFDPALINRFTYRVQFNEISRDVYMNILQDTYKREAERINNQQGLNLPAELTNVELDTITNNTYDPAFGARPAYQAVKDHIEEIVFQTP